MRHVSRRRILQGSLGLAGTAALGSHRRPVAASRQGGVAIEFWHRATGGGAQALIDLAADFNAEYAGQITVTPVPKGNVPELNQAIRAAAVGGGLPAATQGDDYDIAQYAANEVIVPLDPYLDDPEIGLTAEQRADFLPGQLERHRLPLYENRTMAFPQAFAAFTCFWNADALRRAGFDGPPATWQEFPDHVRAVAKANPGMAGWNISGAGDRFISCLLTHGIQWLSDDGQSSNFDRPEALEIMTWWKELYDEGLLTFPSSDVRDTWVAGQCAYYMDTSTTVGSARELVTAFAWDAGLPPQGENNPTPVTETYDPVNALPATNEEQQRAGWLWLKWLTTPDALARWVIARNVFPATSSAVESPALEEYYAANPVAAKLVREVAPPDTPRFNRIPYQPRQAARARSGWPRPPRP
jgi:ABC-type glycerol-3-phosphate transport system substrate-binding protein